MMIAPSCDFVDLPGVNDEKRSEEREEYAGDLEGEDTRGVGEGMEER